MDNAKHSAMQTLRAAAEKWPTTILPRIKVPTFTGGLYSSGYMANMDSRGEGPEGSFWLGRQRVYPMDKFIEWLEKRLEVADISGNPANRRGFKATVKRRGSES